MPSRLSENRSRRTMASSGNKGKRKKMDSNRKIAKSGNTVCSSISSSQEILLAANNAVSCNQTFGSIPLLDMLAEVASATLKNDPSLNNNSRKLNIQKNISTRILSKRSQQSEYLTLDQIRVLSDKMLLEMFSEQTSDEIRRNFSYKCFLMPEKCDRSFSSFGNENKARLQMKSHLLTHIAELLAEANAPGKSHRLKFVAEPLHARRKRLLDGNSKKKRPVKQEKNIKCYRFNSGIKESMKTNFRQTNTTCSMYNGKSRCNCATLPSKKDQIISNRKRKGKIQSKRIDNDDDSKPTENEDQSSTLNSHTNVDKLKQDKLYTKLKKKYNETNDKISTVQSLSPKTSYHAPEQITTQNEEMLEENTKVCCDNRTRTANQEIHKEQVTCVDALKISTAVKSVFSSSVDHSTKTMETKVDTLEQPQHDHCYTTVSGKRWVVEKFNLEHLSSDEENVTVKTNVMSMSEPESTHHLIISTPSFPYVFTPLLPNIAQILEVSCENSDGNIKQIIKIANAENAQNDSSVVQKPKQARVRRINRIIIAEELKSDSEEDSENIPSIGSGKSSTVTGEGNLVLNSEKQDLSEISKNHTFEERPEWEKKLALKCIRALRYKKKEERGPLQCRICKDKKFTAQATLMYHYRSHAGIKPFTCAVCGATFTRQHSLNYHMLIHNNKSRFACSDCGRNFRHPSHYKEHLRRHTGETPYECSDCALRFKTRNTFKRHLKTRHGKILTAQGIVTLTVEEFYKVRTTPRRRIQKSLPIKKKDQETQWPEVNIKNNNELNESVEGAR